MKCQNCKNIEANFHYTIHINAKVSETHLCEKCARELGFDNAFSGLSPSFFEAATQGFRSPARFLQNFTIPGFSPIGLMPAQKATPPAIRRPEAAPIAVDETIKRRRESNELRAKLKNAVAAEEYEKAAVLRDELRSLEKEAENN